VSVSESERALLSAPAPAGAGRAPLDDVRRRLELLTLVRLGVATGLLILTLALDSFGAQGNRLTTRVFMAVVVAIYVASVGYAVALSRWKNVRALAVIQIGLDLAAWTAIVAATGGPLSPMSFFFALSTLTAALVLGERAARVTAVVAIATYGTMAVVMTPGALAHIPGLPFPPRGRSTPPEAVFQILITVIATLLVGALGGSLASRLTRTGGALARVEASRAALEALYEDVVRSIPVALLTCSKDGRIDAANPVSVALFGTSVETLLGSRVDRWMPFIGAGAFTTSDPAPSGDAVIRRDGVDVSIAFYVAPLYDRDAKVRGGLIVLEDRTTVESMRATVQRTERLAVLGRLAAALAHEIRNPLGAISGCVELVREGATLGEENRALLVTVQTEVARLNDLVTDMLAFARPRPPEKTMTDLVAIARDVARMAGASASEPKRVDVRVEPEGDVVMADVDAGQIKQVLWNLVRNGLQASAPGQNVEVVIGGGARDATLSVRDRGRGIAADQRERVFELFYSEQSRGTGLGLAIVKQIVDAHGGTVAVRARDGGGTEFVVSVPAAPGT